MKKPKVNLGICIGCGTCESMCSECFKIEEDGKSHALRDCAVDCCNLQEVVEACPVQAITLES